MNVKAQEAGTLQSLLLGILFMIILAVSGIMYIGSLSTNYNVAYNESEFSSFNRTQELVGITGDLTERLDNSTSQPGAFDIVTIMITTAYTTTRVFWDTPGILYSIIVDTVNILHLPMVIANLIMTGIMILVIFAMLMIFLKVKG